MAGASRSTVPTRSFRKRQKQTRLQFSPLPSLSPAKERDSQAVQDRHAGVTLKGAKTLARTADEVSPDPISLLSPEPSSQVQDETSEEAAQMAGQTSFPPSPTRDRVTQFQLSDDSDEDDLITPAQKRQKLSNTLAAASTPISLPSRRSKRLNQGAPSSSPLWIPMASVDDVDELQSSPPKTRSGRLQNRSTPEAPSPKSESSLTLPSPEPSSPLIRQAKLSDLGSPETSDDDLVMVTKPTIRRKSRLDMDDPFIVNNDDVQYESDARRRSRRTPQRKKSRRDDFIVEDDEVDYMSSENEGRRDRGSKRKPSKGEKFVVNDDEEVEVFSSEDEVDNSISPSATRSHRRSTGRKDPKKHRLRTQQEQDELEEDLQDLQGSDQETPRTKAKRTRGGPVTTQRDKIREHLELLKRRRAGEKIPRIADSDEEMDEEPAAADIDYIGQPDYEVSDGGSISNDTDQSTGNENIEQEETEDDFIENDVEGRLGRPHSAMPIQFTAFATKKPKELFIHIIEWMVKNKIAPAFDREDEVYRLAFARVDDQVKAQAGSRLISAAWGSDFKYAILARPNMTVEALPGEDEDHMRTCDACNRTNNPARYEFIFSGEPYYQKTLEPVDNSDEDEEDEEDDANSITYDEAGHVIASSDTRFYLGRFCAANAQMGHKLVHWKHNLNDSLMTYLESQGVLSADAIIAREKMNKKKREKEAENIVDNMEETGQLDEFWQEFENDLNDARIGMQDFEKRGGRTKGRVGAIRSKSGGFIKEWDKDKFRTTIALGSDSEGE